LLRHAEEKIKAKLSLITLNFLFCHPFKEKEKQNTKTVA